MNESTDTAAAARLEHAFFFVEDLDRSLDWYGRILPGWVVRWDGRAEGQRWVHFGPPGEGQPGYLSICEGAAGEAGEEGGHLGFAHPDVNALEKELAARGIRPTDHADDGRYRRFYLEDPDGHELEFVQKLR